MTPELHDEYETYNALYYKYHQKVKIVRNPL